MAKETKPFTGAEVTPLGRKLAKDPTLVDEGRGINSGGVNTGGGRAGVVYFTKNLVNERPMVVMEQDSNGQRVRRTLRDQGDSHIEEIPLGPATGAPTRVAPGYGGALEGDMVDELTGADEEPMDSTPSRDISASVAEELDTAIFRGDTDRKRFGVPPVPYRMDDPEYTRPRSIARRRDDDD